MLKCVRKIQDIEGKIVKLARTDGEDVVISFADESFIWFHPSCGYDGDDAEVEILGEENVLGYISDLARDAGIITREEHEEYHLKKDQLRESLERQRYEVLKAKFEKESK